MSKKLEIAKREKRIMVLIEQGTSTSETIALVAHEYRVSEKTVRNQYYKLIKGLGNVSSSTKEEWRGVILARQEALYRQAISRGNVKNANDVLNSQAKILGLNEKTAETPDRAETIVFKPKDMSAPLEVVPETEKAEND